MLSDVKKAKWDIAIPSNYSVLWLFYFLFSIAVIGSIAAYFFALPCMIVGRVFRPMGRLGGKVLQLGVATLMKVQPWFNFETDVQLPKRNPGRVDYVTFSNHRSHLDMFILLTLIPGIRVVTKAALYKVPFLNIMLWALKNFPVKKGDKDSYLKAMNDMVWAIKEGEPVHLFPEMTRCEPGFTSVQDFHLFPFHAAMKTQVPLIPLVFIGSDDAWPKGTSALSYRKKVLLKQLPAILSKDFNSAEELRDKAKSVIQKALDEAYSRR